MNCLQCQTLNPNTAKFCFNCGTPLAQTQARCSNCGEDLLAGARFCMACGQPVAITTPADHARLTRMAASAPAPLAEKMRAAHLTGERKPVTCLFADVVGSTALAEQMDPDDWTAIMNRAFDLLSPAVYRYEGTIARLMGDAVLAFFGAPLAHEDDPVRAVRAALDMLDAARAYADEVRGKSGIEFAIRVGLNSGTVVVGNVGSDLKYEYTAMGDAVNLAARMQSAAQPNTVLISEHTYRFVAPVFVCNDLGLIEVKGKSDPVRVYEVARPKTTPGRVRGLESSGLESPLVGRAPELAALRQVGVGLAAGRGQIVALLGEAGLGKSRLIGEWMRLTPGVRWVQGSCLSYGQGLPYHLLVDLLHSFAGVAAQAGEAELSAALAGLCAGLSADTFHYLAHMISLPLDAGVADKVRALDPQTVQARYLEALTALLHEAAAGQPLGLILDDVHWADPSSVELLGKLCTLAGEHALVFCFITRPDPDAPGWKLITRARELGAVEVSLEPLSDSESRQLVSNLLEVEALPESIRTTILQKAEGNPFFVEEVIRMFIDRAAIVPRGNGWAAASEIGLVEIPDNVQGLLLARIDRLAEEAKRTLRVAAVIGRQFAVRVLEQIVEAARYLHSLEGYGLIRLAASQPELEYLFRHALVQEAAYASLVKQDRRQLHLAVGETLEALYPERLATREMAVLLAQHFYLGGDDTRALPYVVAAGDAAAGVYANPEAILHYTRALEIVKRASAATPAKEGIDVTHLYTSLGNVLELNAQYSEAMTLYGDLEALARARADRRMEFSAVMARAKVLATPNPAFDPPAGRAALERALELARQIGDRADECRILWNLLVLETFSGGDMRRAIDWGEQSIAIARELNLRERLAFAVQDLHYAYFAVDQGDMAWERLNEARALWRELGIVPMLADNLANSAIRHYERGEFGAARATAAESFELYKSIHNAYGMTSSQFAVTPVYVAEGLFDEALTLIETGLANGERGGHLVGMLSLLVQKARALLELNQHEAAMEAARRALSIGETNFPLWAPMAHAMIARLLIAAGHLDAAEKTVADGQLGLQRQGVNLYGRELVGLAACDLALAQGDLEAASASSEALQLQIEKAGTRIFLPEALFLKARALMGMNRMPGARAVLAQARTLAHSMGERRIFWQLLATASEVEGRLGDAAAARIYGEAAASQIEALSRQISNAALRASFLSRADVQNIMMSFRAD